MTSIRRRFLSSVTLATFICFPFQRVKIKQPFHFNACNSVSLKYLQALWRKTILFQLSPVREEQSLVFTKYRTEWTNLEARSFSESILAMKCAFPHRPCCYIEDRRAIYMGNWKFPTLTNCFYNHFSFWIICDFTLANSIKHRNIPN